MAWTEICGGSKVILEYVNRLSQKGHNITIITYDKKPNWFPMNKSINFIQVPIDREIHEYITDADIIVATSWKCIYEAIESNKAPVVFFEQGGSHLFSKSELEELKIEKLNNRYKMVPFIYTVSEYSRSVIKKEFLSLRLCLSSRCLYSLAQVLFLSHTSRFWRRSMSNTPI